MIEYIVRLWRAVKRLYTFFLPIRFSLIALLVLLFAFWFADQGTDILRALIEDRARGTLSRLLLLIGATNLLAYLVWYWSRQLLRFRPHGGPAPHEMGRATTWTPRVAGLLVFVIELVGFARVGLSHVSQRTRNFWVVMALLAVSAIVFLFLVLKRRKIFRLWDESLFESAESWSDFAKGTRRVLLLTIVMELLLFIWALVNPVSWWIFGVGAALVMTIAVWVPLGSVLVAIGEYWRFPILGALLVWAVAISRCADNHDVRTAGPLPPSRPTIEQAFDAWYARVSKLPNVPRPIPAIVVATEGGGIRAAYWTATALTAIQDQIPTFADHTFAISGVSGGSLGAAAFNALLARRLEAAGVTDTTTPISQLIAFDRNRSLHGDARAMLDFDALSGTLAAMSQPDLVQRFVPIPALLPDRAKALEQGWEHGWYRAFGTQRDLFARPFLQTMQKHPQLPVLLLNGTLVETGDRIITSNVRLRPSPGFRNALDAFDHLKSDIRISTAALMSARFTYVSPAGTIPNKHELLNRKVYGHVVDGGYFENSGAVTAAEVVQMIRTRGRGDVRPVVIVIDYWNTSKQKQDDPRPFCPSPGICGPGSPNRADMFASEVLSPLRALLNTRGARGMQAVGDLVETMGNDPVYELRLVPRNVPLPLGWVLSERAQDSIDAAVDCEGGNRTAVRMLAALLGRPIPPNWSDPVAAAAREAQKEYATVPCVSPDALPSRVDCSRNGCGSGVSAKAGVE